MIIPKERIFLTGDVMTKYEEARTINRAVKKSLKRQLGEPVYIRRRSSDLPAYVTDNPFYP